MNKVNHVMMMGHLTRDPDVHEIPSGTMVAKMGVATSQNGAKKEDGNNDEPCFVDVEAWGKQAEACGKYLTKGSPVLVEGSLRYSQWETKEGEKRTKIAVRAFRVHFLNKGGNGKSGKGSNPGNDCDW